MSKLANYTLLTLKVALPIALLLAGSDAFAANSQATIGGQLGNLEGEVEAGGSLFKTVVGLVGAGICASGLWSLYKSQTDDSRDHPVKKALAAILVGGAMLSFSVFTDMASGTSTGAAVEEAEVFERKTN